MGSQRMQGREAWSHTREMEVSRLALTDKQLERIRELQKGRQFNLVRSTTWEGEIKEGFPGHTRRGQMGRVGEVVNKLSADDVTLIRRLYHSGLATQVELAEVFDVSQANISYIVRNRTWKGWRKKLQRISL